MMTEEPHRRVKARVLLTKVYVHLAHMEQNLAGGDTEILRNFRNAMRLLDMEMILLADQDTELER